MNETVLILTEKLAKANKEIERLQTLNKQQGEYIDNQNKEIEVLKAGIKDTITALQLKNDELHKKEMLTLLDEIIKYEFDNIGLMDFIQQKRNEIENPEQGKGEKT